MTTKALDTQVGGSHYKEFGIQPWEYISANKLGFGEGCIVKYISRWREKGGIEDLKKIQHYCQLMIEDEEKCQTTASSVPNDEKTILPKTSALRNTGKDQFPLRE